MSYQETSQINLNNLKVQWKEFKILLNVFPTGNHHPITPVGLRELKKIKESVWENVPKLNDFS